MKTQFSAGAQMLGYVHQVRFALLSILSGSSDDTQLHIETYDDVVTQSGGKMKWEQLKHHMDATTTFTDSSVELWRTLRVWCSQFKSGHLKPEESMVCLVTTATASPGTAISYLRNDQNRNVAKAIEGLTEIAKTSENESLISSFKAYSALDEVELIRLFNVVYLVDGSIQIQDVPSKIKQELVGVLPQHRESLYESLEGWWFNQVIDHLNASSANAISRYEVVNKIGTLNSSYGPESLPLDFILYKPSEEIHQNSQDRQFVRQLQVIKTNVARIRKAVENYYKAFEQRTKWVRDQLIVTDEVIVYEQLLIDEWETQVAAMIDRLPIATDEECETFGKELLTWAEMLDLPIRNKMPIGHEYVCRGSFHILADVNNPKIYWHPRFLDQLKAFDVTLDKAIAK